MRLALLTRTAAALALCSMAAAQLNAATLPDLRGRTFSASGTLTIQGSILGQDLGAAFPNGVDIPVANPAKVILSSTGAADNSNLTGSITLPSFSHAVNGTYYVGSPNPTVPLSNGSFNQATGKFTITGSLPGNSAIDFGVYDLSAATSNFFGLQRVFVTFQNLAITLNGTGAFDANGAFAITNPGTDFFSFVIQNGFFSGTPSIILNPPNDTNPNSGAGTSIVISNPKFGLKNWTVQGLVSGNLALQGVDNLANVSVGAPVAPLTFDFRAPGTTNVLYTRTSALVPVYHSANGTYAVTGIPFGTYDLAIKGAKNLRKVIPGVVVQGTVAPAAQVLPAGDANNDNVVDIADFGALVNAYNGDAAVAGSGYDPAADFNFDGKVDIADFGILVNNYNLTGDN